jgi:hypothetical protein
MAARLRSVSSSDWPASETKLRSSRMSETVRHLYGPLRIVYEDPLDLSPLLLIATAALFGERLDPLLLNDHHCDHDQGRCAHISSHWSI